MSRIIKILGIDPGTATTGWGLITRKSAHEMQMLNYNVIRTKSKQLLEHRIEQIFDQLTNLINLNKPDVLAVESVFFNTNTKTAMLVGQARGAVLLAGRKSQIQIEEYTPLQVKMAVTGYGRAEKYQVQKMVKTLLNLKEVPKPDDAADALAVAITCGLTINGLKQM